MPSTAQVDQIKEKHRAIWDSGDYGDVARRLVAEVGEVTVERAGIGPGMEVLDVACGTGNATIPAAEAGAAGGEAAAAAAGPGDVAGDGGVLDEGCGGLGVQPAAQRQAAEARYAAEIGAERYAEFRETLVLLHGLTRASATPAARAA